MRSDRKGFSLIEVMCAITILGVALVGLTQGITTALGSSKESELQTTAALLAAGRIETLRAEGYFYDGVEEGECGDDLPQYQYTQTISSTAINGLHSVQVSIKSTRTGQTIYELETLLFDASDVQDTPTDAEVRQRQEAGREAKVKIAALRAHSAFTLIELVISASLMAMILTGAYMCLNAAISGQKLIEPRAEVIQNARVIMSMISADLRSACPLSKDYEFLGMHRMLDDIQADNLDFATHNYSPRRENEGDFCEVSYFVQKEGETGRVSLWRRRNPTIAPDPLSGGNREQLARGLRGISFEYFDGFDWYDTWGEIRDRKKQKDPTELPPNMSGMPEAVRVTLWLDPNPKPPKEGAETKTPAEPPLVFQTVVRLNLSASSQSGLSSGPSSGSSSTSPAQASEGNPQ